MINAHFFFMISITYDSRKIYSGYFMDTSLLFYKQMPSNSIVCTDCVFCIWYVLCYVVKSIYPYHMNCECRRRRHSCAQAHWIVPPLLCWCYAVGVADFGCLSRPLRGGGGDEGGYYVGHCRRTRDRREQHSNIHYRRMRLLHVCCTFARLWDDWR